MLRELRLLFPYVRRYRGTYVLGALCIVVGTVLKVLIPRFLGEALDTLKAAAEEGDDAPGLTPDEGLELVVVAALTIIGTALVMSLIRTASRLLILGGARKVVYDLRNDVFDKLLRLAPSYYVQHSTGGIMSRAVNDVQNVQGLTGPVFMYLAETAVLYVFCLSFMLDISPTVTLAGFLPFPLFIVAARRYASRIQHGSRAAQRKLGEVSAKVDESLSGHMVIKSLTLEDFDRERFRERAEQYRDMNLEVAKARGTLMPMMMALASLSVLVVLLFAGPRVARGEISVGRFVQMVIYLQMMAAPTGIVGFVVSSLQRGQAALGRIREVLEADETLSDPAEPVEDPVANGGLSVRGLSIAFDPMEIDEESGEPVPAANPELGRRTVIDDVSFEVPAGSTLGIVGPTGAGKSVLAAALARLVEVEPGRVFVDDTDVTHARLGDVRGAIGYVPQETFLFGASLRDNVALARPDASDEEVDRAVRVAQLEKDLPQLPDGLATRVGERGVNLSGGQRQRTALARAVLAEPRILILDDTLSAVDANTAEDILAELRPVMAGRTTVIVAHRLATLRDADRIVVLEDGRLTESGTHAELLALGGYYRRLWDKQQRTEALAAELEVDPESFDGEAAS